MKDLLKPTLLLTTRLLNFSGHQFNLVHLSTSVIFDMFHFYFFFSQIKLYELKTQPKKKT